MKQADISERDHVIQQEIIAVSQLLDAPQHATQTELRKVIHHDRRNVLDLTANKPVNTENGDAIQQTPFGAPKL